MKARRLGDITQVSASTQPEVLAEGMRLLVEHAISMTAAAKAVRAGQPNPLLDVADLPPHERAARVVDAIVVEEVGAFLILADIARTAIGDKKALGVLTKRFTNHLAKGIYANLGANGIGSHAEAQREADRLRADRYLDGPNDVDFVFRNDILAAREDPMYVDYVEVDGQHRWITPGQSWASTGNARRGIRLAAQLYMAGAATPDGIRVLSKVWRGHEALWVPGLPAATPNPFDPDPPTTTALYSLNCATLDALETAGVVGTQYSAHVRSEIASSWSLPLNCVSVDVRRVTDADLAAERERWSASQAGYY